MTISRDSLTPEGKQELSRRLNHDLLPAILPLLEAGFEKVWRDDDEVKKQYYHYCLNATKLGLKCYNVDRIADYELNKNEFAYKGGRVTAKQLWEAKNIDVINVSDDVFRRITQNKAFIDEHKETIIANDSEQLRMLSPYFVCTLRDYNSKGIVFKLSRADTGDKPKPTEITNCAVGNYLHHRLMDNFVWYAVDYYKKLACKMEKVTGLEVFPDFCNCCIYNPFRCDMYRETLDEIDNVDKAKKYVDDNFDKIVTPQYIKVVKEHNIDPAVKEEEIKRDYRRLIFDMICAERRIGKFARTSNNKNSEGEKG